MVSVLITAKDFSDDAVHIVKDIGFSEDDKRINYFAGKGINPKDRKDLYTWKLTQVSLYEWNYFITIKDRHQRGGKIYCTPLKPEEFLTPEAHLSFEYSKYVGIRYTIIPENVTGAFMPNPLPSSEEHHTANGQPIIDNYYQQPKMPAFEIDAGEKK